MVSSGQQVARIRRLAMRALDSCPLADPELPLIAHGENAALRVDVTARGGLLSGRADFTTFAGELFPAVLLQAHSLPGSEITATVRRTA